MSKTVRLRPEQTPEAVAYIRVSRRVQADGYSPETQREHVRQLAREQGYLLDPTNIFEDHEHGSNITRKGYQEVIERVCGGTAHAVLVFMFDRWGRDGAEWLARAREFEKLGVPIISAQEGRDQGGLIRFVRAGMAEQFSRDLAKKVQPNREAAARRGTHMGQTPYGCVRVYPSRDNSDRLPAGRIEPDDGPEGQAWVVRELFRRYAAGGESLRTLAHWLNADPRVGPAPGLAHWLKNTSAHRGPRPPGIWTSPSVRHILRNPSYKGAIRYNHQPSGLYERAAPGSEFIVEGAHTPVVSAELWEDVQDRLTRAKPQPTYNITHTASGRTVALGSGLLRCGECGGPMYVVVLKGHRRYLCCNRTRGELCVGRMIWAEVAHTALLAEVRRLRGAPWTPQAEHRLLMGGGAEDGARTAALATALEDAQRRRANNLRLIETLDAPTPEEIADFRARAAEISVQVQTLKAQLSGAQQAAEALSSLHKLHQKLTMVEIPDVVDAALGQGNTEALRALVLPLVASARLVERTPTWNAVWARVEVTWTPDVQKLLDAGLLQLEPPAPEPRISTSEERRVAREQERNIRRRAAYAATRDANYVARMANYLARLHDHKERAAEAGKTRPPAQTQQDDGGKGI